MEQNNLDLRDTFYPEGVKEKEQEVTPTTTVDAAPVFPAPFKATYGNSSVDLSIKENNDKMLEEYDAYWNERDKDQRQILGDEFHQKYYGMSLKEAREAKRQNMGSMYGSSNPLKVLDDTFQGLSAPGLGLADFFVDAAGTMIPGMDRVDDWWDEQTKLDSEWHQQLRRVSSIVLPSLLFSKAADTQLTKLLPAAKRFGLKWWGNLSATMAVH